MQGRNLMQLHSPQPVHFSPVYIENIGDLTRFFERKNEDENK
jgi:hypothetical protein